MTDVSPTADLTERQRDIYEFMFEFMFEHRYPPTVRDIGKRFKIKSPNGVMCHLKALVKKGVVSNPGGKTSRGYVPVTLDSKCPCCGQEISDE